MTRRNLSARAAAVGIVIATILVAAGGALAVSRDEPGATAAPEALSCPRTVTDSPDVRPPVVPPPATGTVDADAGLAPVEGMRAAVICAYRPDRYGTTAVPLTGSVRLPATQLPALGDDLAFLPRRSPGEPHACQLVGSVEPPTTYLVGLGYSDATLWISTKADPNWCVDTTNGSFTSSTYIGDQVEAAYRAGAWVAPPARPQPVDDVSATRR